MPLENELEPSLTTYKKFGKGLKPLLRFSKSQTHYIENFYATQHGDVKRSNEINLLKAGPQKNKEQADVASPPAKED